MKDEFVQLEGLLKIWKPSFDLWCENYNEIETDPFILLNGILYWTDKTYTKIKGTVNTNTHKVIKGGKDDKR